MLLAVALTHLADPENATSAYEQAGKLYVFEPKLETVQPMYQYNPGCQVFN